MARITKWRHGLQRGNSPLAKIDYDTLDTFKYNHSNGHLVGTAPLQTTLSSLYLEEYIKLSSDGTNVALTNLDNNRSTYPAGAVLKDHTDVRNLGDAGVIPIAAPSFGPVLGATPENPIGGVEPRGPASENPEDVVPFELDTTLGASLSIFAIEVIVEEEIYPTDYLDYTIYNGPDHFSRAAFHLNLTGKRLRKGDTFRWELTQHSNLTKGSVLHIEMLLNRRGRQPKEDWRPLKVRASASATDKIYAKLFARSFSYEPLALAKDANTQIGKHEWSEAIDGNNHATLHDADLQWLTDEEGNPLQWNDYANELGNTDLCLADSLNLNTLHNGDNQLIADNEGKSLLWI